MVAVTTFHRKMPKRTDRLTDLILKRIEALRAQHGAPGAPMKQKTVARRSGQTYARVHKFLSGQMPYPPLDFLDAILRSFGTTLADALRGPTDDKIPLPIVREDVQEVANMLDEASPAAVEAAKQWIELFARAQGSGGSIDRSPSAHHGASRRAPSGSSAKRGTRRE